MPEDGSERSAHWKGPTCGILPSTRCAGTRVNSSFAPRMTLPDTCIAPTRERQEQVFPCPRVVSHVRGGLPPRLEEA
jgi:hypothetical protein